MGSVIFAIVAKCFLGDREMSWMALFAWDSSRVSVRCGYVFRNCC